MEIKEVFVKSAVNKTKLPGLDYSLNPYRGCGYGCVYCYVPDMLFEKREWGTFADVKMNLPTVLAKQIKKLKPGLIGIGTACDPYQPVEKKYKITQQCLRVLQKTDFEVCVQTKSDLVLRDLDLIKKFGKISIGFTITSLDPVFSKKMEPGAPLPEKRLAALQKLNENKIQTWAFVGPTFPGIDYDKIVQEIVRTGTKEIWYDKLRLRPRILGKIKKVWPDFEYADVAEDVKRACGKYGAKPVSAF